MPTISKDENTVVEFTPAEFNAIIAAALADAGVNMPDMEEPEDQVFYTVLRSDGQQINCGLETAFRVTLRDVE